MKERGGVGGGHDTSPIRPLPISLILEKTSTFFIFCELD